LNLGRILSLAAAIAAVAAAAAVCVVAAAFAVYALVKSDLGPAGGAAVVAAVFALVAVVAAWLATRKVAPRARTGASPEPASLVDTAIGLAKTQPLLALGVGAAAAVAAVTVAVRNPAVVTAIVSAFLAGNAAKPDK
jgi:hypothetical protein